MWRDIREKGDEIDFVISAILRIILGLFVYTFFWVLFL